MVRRSFLLILSFFLLVLPATAEPQKTYEGVILSNRSTPKKEASLLAAAHSFRFVGLTSTPLTSRAVLVEDPRLQHAPAQPYERKRSKCRTARIRRIIQRAQGHIQCSENYELTAAVTPNDQGYSKLYGMELMSAPAAWDITTGTDSAVVMVIDTGIYGSHQDLFPNIWVNPKETPNNYRDDDGNGYVDDLYGMNAITKIGSGLDDNGHGTHVAGTIGAVGNNGEGVAGVVWNVKLLGAKFLSSTGSGSTANAIRAIQYGIDMKKRGVNIIAMNNSYGGASFSSPLLSTILDANTNGILFIAAAGNNARSNDSSPTYPANYDAPNVISVAAVDQYGGLAYFSNYGPNSVHIGAPGRSIYSTYPKGTYTTLSGTSMACPHVVGLAALTYAACPRLTIAQIKEFILKKGVRTIDLRTKVSTSSIANAAGSVTAARAYCNQPTPTPTFTPDPSGTPTPTPTITPTPTPTATATPTPTPKGPYIEVVPSSVPMLGTTAIQAWSGTQLDSVVGIKMTLFDSEGTSYPCASTGVMTIQKGSRRLNLKLPDATKYFIAIRFQMRTLRSEPSTTLLMQSSQTTLVPYSRAALACTQLEKLIN